MITQTKRIVKALLDAGYKRSEFRVRTPCNHRGEYQDTEILIWSNKDRQFQLLDAVLETKEIDVTLYRPKGSQDYGYPQYNEGWGHKKIIEY